MMQIFTKGCNYRCREQMKCYCNKISDIKGRCSNFKNYFSNFALVPSLFGELDFKYFVLKGAMWLVYLITINH